MRNETSSSAASSSDSIHDKLNAMLQSSDDEFTVASYLNLALSSTDNTSTANTTSTDELVQRRMTELALELQFMTQSCHEEIGKIGIELQAIIPRCSSDINRVSVGLNGLQMDAEQLLYDTTGKRSTGQQLLSSSINNKQKGGTNSNSTSNRSEESKTILEGNEEDFDDDDDNNNNTNNTVPLFSTIETLSTLHALQSNLTRTKEILTAAASWDTTVASIVPLLTAAATALNNTTTTSTSTSTSTNSASALAQAVECFIQLENGEQALRGMPNPQERQQSVQKLRTQLSSLLQPQLKYALATMTQGVGTATTSTGTGSSSTTTSSHMALQQCVQLYSQLGQIDTFKNEYIKQRPVVTGIHKLWFEYKPSVPGVSATTSTTASSFAEWLPGWYDAILTLLADERRQSTIIFGTNKQQQQNTLSNLHMVPEVIIRVLTECFRPILPSFQSRLETICSSVPVPAGGGSATSGSLRDIATVYESMLQFLSLVYESITSGWLDMVESGLIVVTNNSNNITNDSGRVIINNAPTLYKELTKVFIYIMSPFTSYQKNLSKLETRFLQSQITTLNQQVQSIVKTVTTCGTNTEAGWEVLQSTSMDELLSMPNQVIPIIEDAISRFELLNGGYDTPVLVQTVDQVLSSYATLLCKAVQTLTSFLITGPVDDTGSTKTTATTTAKTTAPSTFDEANVLCALQVLKLAGTYNRTLNVLQVKTNERLNMLAQRITIQSSRDKQLQDTYQQLLKGKNSSFQIPETISVIELDSIVTNAVLSTGENSDGADSITATPDATKLFPDGLSSSIQLASTCHTFVFDVCFAIPRYHLNGTASMSSWKESKSLLEGWGGTSSSPTSYGTLPQPFITQVGEHMLALVQALEPFAEDPDALTISNTVMDIDIVRRVAMPYWHDFVVAATGSPCSEESLRMIMAGKEFIDFVIGVVPVDDDGNVDEDNGDTVDDANTASSTLFCNKWLDVVGLAVAGRLLERIMRIPSLSSKGCDHLNADLGYIVNVFSALGVSGHPHPLLGHIAELCILDKEIIFERIDNFDRTNPTSDFLRSVEERLSAMRGLS